MYSGLSGVQYQLDQPFKSGGEGMICNIINKPKYVAKLYKNNKVSELAVLERKIKAMINMNIDGYVDGKLRLAWPKDALYEDGHFVGFVMPKFEQVLPLITLQRCNYDKLSPSLTKTFPNFSWKMHVQCAYTLASIVSYLHQNGIVVGDMNVQNILIDTTSKLVVLIDCDSFDIVDQNTNEHFPCMVGQSEVLAPELQVIGKIKWDEYSTYSDDFTLAIHIFRLLMKNADPFGGIASDTRSSNANTNLNLNIANGECPYVRECSYTIPSYVPDYGMLPKSVQDGFKKTFSYDALTFRRTLKQRTTAAMWCDILYPLAVSQKYNHSLKTCPMNPCHVYYKQYPSCPWCDCIERMKTNTPNPYHVPTLVSAPTPTPAPSPQPTSQVNTATASQTTNDAFLQIIQGLNSSNTKKPKTWLEKIYDNEVVVFIALLVIALLLVVLFYNLIPFLSSFLLAHFNFPFDESTLAYFNENLSREYLPIVYDYFYIKVGSIVIGVSAFGLLYYDYYDGCTLAKLLKTLIVFVIGVIVFIAIVFFIKYYFLIS